MITLLTDFGDRDYYLAAMKGVLLQRAPGAVLVDVSHQVAAGDIAGAGWLLGAAWRWFPDGTVHLAVVDPGVGSRRRMVAAEVRGHRFVAPDNGLLSWVLRTAADAAVHAIERPDLYLDGDPNGDSALTAGRTFAGRDRFAPAAAALADGESLPNLGPEVTDPVLLTEPEPVLHGPPGRAGSRLEGSVAHIDHYGNLVTNLPSEWIGNGACRTTVGSGQLRHRIEVRAGHYEEIPAGQAALLPGSLGTLELAYNGEPLAPAWGVRRGEPVEVTILAD
ncbi:MAG: SAM-dependent chlorinase/fluorinase [Acidobacteriota bacterium]